MKLLLRLGALVWVFPVLGVLAWPVDADASLSPILFRIEASSSLGTDVWEVPSTALQPDGTWTLGAPRQLKYGAQPTDVIATLSSATMTIVSDNQTYPRLNMNFELMAGAQDVTVEIASAYVYSNLPGAQAIANAAFSITDVINDGIDATAERLPSAYGMFVARYNGNTPVVALVGEVTIGGGATGQGDEWWPTSGWGEVGADATDFSAWYGFTLTAHDLVTGQNAYWITPEPATLGLLSAAVAALRRRR